MGKNEIKLSRQILRPEDIGRYRNYPALLRKHRRQGRFKLFTSSILITLVVVLLLIIVSFLVIRWQKKKEVKTKEHIQTSLPVRHNKV